MLGNGWGDGLGAMTRWPRPLPHRPISPLTAHLTTPNPPPPPQTHTHTQTTQLTALAAAFRARVEARLALEKELVAAAGRYAALANEVQFVLDQVEEAIGEPILGDRCGLGAVCGVGWFGVVCGWGGVF
jgi:hypothetical protein